MSIRLRVVAATGATIALCAARTTHMPGDLYLDDVQHEALAKKFVRDGGWSGFHRQINHPLECESLAVVHPDGARCTRCADGPCEMGLAKSWF